MVSEWWAVAKYKYLFTISLFAISLFAILARLGAKGGDAHVDAIRHRPRPQRGELPAADPAVLPGARGRGLSGYTGDHPWRVVAELPGVLCARQAAGLGVGATRRQARRHCVGDARQHAGDDRGALRRADDRRGSQHAQHPARRRDPRLHARSRRDQSADRRSRAFQGDEGCAGARQGKALGHRLRRSGIRRRRRADRQHRIRGFSARGR